MERGGRFMAKFGHIVTEQTRNKLREINLGKKASEESKIKMSKSLIEGYKNGTRKPYWLGKKQSPESSIKKSNKLKGKSYEELFGKEKAEELKEIRKKINKGQFKKNFISWNKGIPCSDKTKKKLRKIGIEMWKDEKYRDNQISQILKGLLKRPTSYEKRVSDLCIQYNLPFIYCGNGTFIVGGKNPDFKHESLPIVIEVYNKFHHPENYEEIRNEHFEKYGYKVIFIRENEILDKDYENICSNKINKGVLK